MQGPLHCPLTCRCPPECAGRFGGISLASVMERSPWICKVDLPKKETLLPSREASLLPSREAA